VGFEPKVPVFERAKLVHGLDPAATVIDILSLEDIHSETRFFRLGGLNVRVTTLLCKKITVAKSKK
jgi:hypothetical protein